MKDLELDMQKAKLNETAYLYSYLINRNDRGHSADLDIEINKIQSVMYNIVKGQNTWMAKYSQVTSQ